MRPRRRGPPARQEIRVPRRPITSPQLNPSKTQDAVKTYVMRYVLGNTLIGDGGTKYAPMHNLVSATARAHRMMNDSPKGAQDPSVNKDKQQASGEAGTSSSPASIPRGPKATKRKAHQARRIKVDEAERSRASHALTVSQRQAQRIAGRPPASSKRLAQPEANTVSHSENSAPSHGTVTDSTPGAPLTRRTPKTQGANWGHTPNLSLDPTHRPALTAGRTSGTLPQAPLKATGDGLERGKAAGIKYPSPASNLFKSHVACALRACFGENARSGCRNALREARVGLPGDLRPPPPLKKRSGASPTQDLSTAWHEK